MGDQAGSVLDGLTVRHPVEADHARVTGVLDEWWRHAPRRPQRALLPRFFFQHFTDTSWVVEQDGQLAGFLIGFMSASRPSQAYIHFIGVHPDLRKKGLAGELYRKFFELCRERGRRQVNAITSPGNTLSIAFHRRLGFTLTEGDRAQGDVPVHSGYEGHDGSDMVVFKRVL